MADNVEDNADGSDEKPVLFKDMGLDDRIAKAIADLGWTTPTLIQEKAIPLALEGRDVVSRARTGSGKTAAFAIPVLHKILQRKQLDDHQGLRAVILAPTKELASQICKHISQLSAYCSTEITCVDIPAMDDSLSSSSFFTIPDIVVSTPGKLIRLIRNGKLSMIREQLEFLVVDEADLMFSLGYANDMKALIEHMPRVYQAFLTSATMNDDVAALKQLLLHNAVTLKLQDGQIPPSSQLAQYEIQCLNDDKFVLIYSLLKLKLISGRTIIFVNSIKRCFLLKLFLEQVGIKACILNSELPAASRYNIVLQFNEGQYDLIIATDENKSNKDDASNSGKPNKQKRKYARDSESGIARGIDFYNVANVINFDFPESPDSYIHRVGRTARGWNRGSALSFVTEADSKTVKTLKKKLASEGMKSVIKPYRFNMEELDGFRYRTKDALFCITSTRIREARLREISEEMLKSEKLQTYFSKNLRDQQVIRHDANLSKTKRLAHLTHVPSYIVPPVLQGVYVGPPPNKKRKRPNKHKYKLGDILHGKYSTKAKYAQKKYKKRKEDPLSSFDASQDV